MTTAQLRTYINTNMLPDGVNGITGTEVRTVLLELCDRVDAASNSLNLVGTTTPAANNEDAYHTGKVIVGRTTDDGSGEKLQATGASVGRLVVQSTGPVNIDTSTPDANTALQVGGTKPFAVTTNLASASITLRYGTLIGWNKSAGLAESNIIFIADQFTNAYLGISCWDGSATTEVMKVSKTGDVSTKGGLFTGTSGAPSDITVYGKIKSYFGSVLRAFAFGGATAGTSLTLKTNQYIQIEIDGTTYKLALVN